MKEDEIHVTATEVFTCKAIAAVVSTALYILYFQIEIIAAQIAIGFNIPVHNTSIYLDKLVCFRSLMFLIGVTSEYIFYRTLIAFSAVDQYFIRRKINLGSFVILLTIRIILFFTTCFSPNVGFHVYLILAVEAFGIGCFGGAIFALFPQHGTVIVLFAHLSRLLTFLIQFFLDLIFPDNPLAKIRCQFLFCSILTATAVGLLFYYDSTRCPTLGNKEENQVSGDTNNGTNGVDTSNPIQKIRKHRDFIYTFGRTFSPFFMLSVGCLLFDIPFPGILPFSFLPREKCHMITMILPIANISGPVLLCSLETADKFRQWGPEFDTGWILAIPMVVIFIYAFLAIHTRIPSAKAIRNSRPRVLSMTFISAFCYSFLDPLSFAGVAKVIFLSEDFIGDVGVLMAHQFFCQAIRFIYLKISVGYNVTRIGLGYKYPKFRPNHRMSKSNAFWYIFKNTFKKAAKDTINEFRMSIKDYL